MSTEDLQNHQKTPTHMRRTAALVTGTVVFFLVLGAALFARRRRTRSKARKLNVGALGGSGPHESMAATEISAPADTVWMPPESGDVAETDDDEPITVVVEDEEQTQRPAEPPSSPSHAQTTTTTTTTTDSAELLPAAAGAASPLPPSLSSPENVPSPDEFPVTTTAAPASTSKYSHWLSRDSARSNSDARSSAPPPAYDTIASAAEPTAAAAALYSSSLSSARAHEKMWFARAPFIPREPGQVACKAGDAVWILERREDEFTEVLVPSRNEAGLVPTAILMQSKN
ncbi:hypothetical protein BDZ88DRAFT_431225 [Geranomyces variabilis]|nr:hypothetical protein BDZ88DRAFT_431225 [Geranomyces variabilis]KAJ3142475.1 hypothetical protein HDU90_004749 [Geranomyces variabilis]